MREEFKNAFKELSIDDKRNELNNEMEVAYSLLCAIKQFLGVNVSENEFIRNYDIVQDSNLNESDVLDLLYCDFYVIQKNIIDIADYIMNKK